jgi:hypothetical protein
MARRSRLVIGAVLMAIVLGLVLPPFINVNRYRKRVTEAISRALGREVTASNIELKLLPRPGLLLSNFVVADDPSYGAEPMLRAETVTASFRLTSLWRGRLEIGRLDLDNPSLNLVRRDDGHWNLEELVERSSQVSPAPTAKTRPEARPRFPYVEASAGRINFKLGQVKKAFAFTDADFALWLESENQWGIRLEARPMRSDVSINDTGTLKLDGRLDRATSLQNTPVNLKLTFTNGPLGQITALIYGHDRGWRGTVSSNAILAGTPAALGITLDAQVEDFRRYDIALGDALRLRVHCTGTYASPDDALRDLQCESPVGPGVLRVRGNAQGWAGRAFNLDISGNQVPAAGVVALVRHAKKDLPLDLTATGDVEAALTVSKAADGLPVWSGGGQTNHLALRSSVLQRDLEIGEMQFVVASSGPVSGIKSKRKAAAKIAKPEANPGLSMVVKPFPLPLGAASPATASALFDQDHYVASLSGEADLARMMNVAKALGIGTPGVGLAGPAQLDLEVAGTWVGFAPPVPSGKVQLHNAIAELQGVNEPLQIASATATLFNQALNLTSFTAAFAQGPQISGSASFPIHCTAAEMCTVRFDARMDDASFARLSQLANPAFRSRPWYRLLAPWQQRNDALMKLRASGHFSIARFEIGSAIATNVSGSAELQAGQMRVTDLHGELLGGKHTGAWTADFTVSPPSFTGSGSMSKLSMAQLAALMHDNWATGAVDAQYSLTMAGANAAALANSAAGSADFTWSGGALRHVILDGHGAPVAFSEFTGKIAVQNGAFTLADCKLQSPTGNYLVKGTALYDRTLNLRLERAGGRLYVISGTLDKPQVTSIPTPAAEASLR